MQIMIYINVKENKVSGNNLSFILKTCSPQKNENHNLRSWNMNIYQKYTIPERKVFLTLFNKTNT